MNDLSNAAIVQDQDGDCWKCKPIPRVAIYVLLSLLLVGLGVSIFILVVVHNAALFLSLLSLSALIAAFLVWNTLNWRRNGAVLLYLHSFPDSDLRLARDGQLVKITGVSSQFTRSWINSELIPTSTTGAQLKPGQSPYGLAAKKLIAHGISNQRPRRGQILRSLAFTIRPTLGIMEQDVTPQIVFGIQIIVSPPYTSTHKCLTGIVEQLLALNWLSHVAVSPWNLHMKRLLDAFILLLSCMNMEDWD